MSQKTLMVALSALFLLFGDLLAHERPKNKLERLSTIQTDPLLQKGALVAVEKGVQAYEKRNPEYTNTLELCLIAIENKTGEIAAYIDGRMYPESEVDYCAKAKRQTGSLFKTFVLTAALELENGKLWGLRSAVLDEEQCYSYYRLRGNIIPIQTPYCPKNYVLETPRYAGKISLEKAFTDSRNAAFMWLGNIIGIGWISEVSERFGFTIPKKSRNLTLVLGTADITPLAMARAFSIFANDGMLVLPETEPVRILSQKTASDMKQALRSVMKHGTGKYAKKIPIPLYGKTGTTSEPDPENQERGKTIDAWFCGFDDRYTVCVWVGSDTRENIGNEESGAKTALPIFVYFMKELNPKIKLREQKKSRKSVMQQKSPEGFVEPTE